MRKLQKIIMLILVLLLLVVPALAVYEEINSSRLSKSEGFGDLEVMTNRYEPYPAQPGKYIDVWIKVENRGDRNIADAQFELIPKYPFSLYENEKARRDLGSFIPFQAALMKYKLKVDPMAVLGNNDLEYAYRENLATDWSQGLIDIYVQPRDLNLAVESISVEPSKIAPGQKGKISLTLKNYGESYAEDIKVYLGLSDAIVPIDSLGEKRVSRIAPGKSNQITFDVLALSDAESKVHTMPIGISYYDNLGKMYNITSVFGLQIAEHPKIYFVVDQTNLVKENTVGKVTIKAVNPGASIVKFLDITLQPSEDYEILSADRDYIGKVDSDDYDTSEFTIFLKNDENGEFLLPIIAKYSDATNEEFVSSENLKVNLAENKYLRKENKSFPIWIILIVLVVVGYFIYRRWKKKKQKK